MNRVHAKRSNYPDLLDAAQGLQGLRYRYSACAAHDDVFTESISRSTSPPPPDRYLQERELFEFFVTGQSALECGAFALYLYAKTVSPQFTAPNHRIKLKTVARDFANALPAEPISLFLCELATSTELKDWRRIRNILTHRSHPGRHFGVGGAPGLSADWLGFSLDSTATSARRRWLASSVNRLLADADSFFARYP